MKKKHEGKINCVPELDIESCGLGAARRVKVVNEFLLLSCFTLEEME